MSWDEAGKWIVLLLHAVVCAVTSRVVGGQRGRLFLECSVYEKMEETCSRPSRSRTERERHGRFFFGYRLYRDFRIFGDWAVSADPR